MPLGQSNFSSFWGPEKDTSNGNQGPRIFSHMWPAVSLDSVLLSNLSCCFMFSKASLLPCSPYALFHSWIRYQEPWHTGPGLQLPTITGLGDKNLVMYPAECIWEGICRGLTKQGRFCLKYGQWNTVAGSSDTRKKKKAQHAQVSLLPSTLRWPTSSEHHILSCPKPKAVHLVNPGPKPQCSRPK